MSKMFVSKKTLDKLNLTPEQYSKSAMGSFYPTFHELNFTHNSGNFEVNPAFFKFESQSFLAKAGLSSKDAILCINNFYVQKYTTGSVESNNVKEQTRWVNLETKETCKGFDLPFVDGEMVKVVCLTFKNKREQTSSEKVINVPFKWSYVIDADAKLQFRINAMNVNDVAGEIKNKLFNQDKAVDIVVKAVKNHVLGLSEENKPIGAFLLTGPTGTGKTELAKLMAEALDYPLVRLDMSEYGQSHQISRMIGSPAGYIGYGDQSVLEKYVGNEKKKVVLLLDEVEKAHEDVQKLLLQVMDNARATLSNNSEVDFSNALILMTSNCGVVQQTNIGMVETVSVLSVDQEKIKQNFLPEFLGRLSAVVEFSPLNKEACQKIMDRILNDFNNNTLKKKGLTLELSERVQSYLLEKGFNVTYGARPLKNFFREVVLDKIANLLIDVAVSDGVLDEKLMVDLDGSNVILVNSPKQERSNVIDIRPMNLQENMRGQA